MTISTSDANTAAASLLAACLSNHALAVERARTFSRWHPLACPRRFFWRQVAAILSQGVA